MSNMINKSYLCINYKDHERLFHVKNKLAKSNFALHLEDPTEDSYSELIIEGEDNKKFCLEEMDDILEKIPEYQDNLLQNAFVELSDEQENHFFLYCHDLPILTFSFQSEDLYVTCLDLKLLKNIENHQLIKQMDKNLLRFEPVMRYKFGSCMIYKNANQIPSLYMILTEIVSEGKYYQSNDMVDNFNHAKQGLFSLSIKNFLTTELKKMQNLLQGIQQNPHHLLQKHVSILIAAKEMFHCLHQTSLNIVKLKKNKIPLQHAQNLQNALTYLNEFENAPSAIMNSFVNLNKRFRDFTAIFLKEE